MVREQLPPTGRTYRALRNQRRPFGTVLAEWIENSLGENRGNAQRVWVIVEKKRRQRVLSILDDGIAPTKLGDVVQLGAGAISGGYDTGRFGWGGAIAQLSFASKSSMWALRADGRIAHDVLDWDEVVDKEIHPAIDSAWDKTHVPQELVELGHGFLLRMEIQPGKNISSNAIRDHLSREFAPALRSGKSITWIENREVTELQPWSPPGLSDVVRETFQVEGLTVELEAGWSDQLSSHHLGLELEYGPRRLTFTKNPFEGYRGETIFGWLRLRGEGWLDHLESEKTGIATDRIRERVEDKARELLTPLMEFLKELRRDQVLIEIGGEVAAKLSEALRKQFPDTSTWEVRGGKREPRGRELKPQTTGRRLYIYNRDDLGPKMWEADCPLHDAWQITLNSSIKDIRRALEEHPTDRRHLVTLLGSAIAADLVSKNHTVEMGLFTQEEWDGYELEYGEPDLVQIATKRLLELITA